MVFVPEETMVLTKAGAVLKASRRATSTCSGKSTCFVRPSGYQKASAWFDPWQMMFRKTYTYPTQSTMAGLEAMFSLFQWRPVPRLAHAVFNEALDEIGRR
jgi:hypothetical protein